MDDKRKSRINKLLFITARIAALILTGGILYLLSKITTLDTKNNGIFIGVVIYFQLAIIPNFFIKIKDDEYLEIDALLGLLVAAILLLKFFIDAKFTLNYETKLALLFYVPLVFLVPAIYIGINLIIDKVYKTLNNIIQKK